MELGVNIHKILGRAMNTVRCIEAGVFEFTTVETGYNVAFCASGK